MRPPYRPNPNPTALSDWPLPLTADSSSSSSSHRRRCCCLDKLNDGHLCAVAPAQHWLRLDARVATLPITKALCDGAAAAAGAGAAVKGKTQREQKWVFARGCETILPTFVVSTH